MWNNIAKFVGSDANPLADDRETVNAQLTRLYSLRDATLRGVGGPEQQIQTFSDKLEEARNDGDTQKIKDYSTCLAEARANKAAGLAQHDNETKPATKSPAEAFADAKDRALVEAFAGKPLDAAALETTYQHALGGQYVRADKDEKTRAGPDADGNLSLASMHAVYQEARVHGH